MASPTLAYLWNGWGLVALGGALTAVPIVIHLLNRRRVRVVPWAAMTFLRAALKRNQRRLQLENWLVLALRVLAVALLGLALARPVVTDSALAGLAGQRRSLYLLLDTSASVGARREARSVLDALKAEAAQALEALDGQDTFCVVLTNDPRVDAASGRAPAVLVPRTSGSTALSKAKESVAALAAREAPAAWADAWALLAQQFANEDAGRQVVVVTDLTARDHVLGAARDRTGEALRALVRRGARITYVDVGGAADSRHNLAVSAVELRGDRPAFPGRGLSLGVRVANHGPDEVRGALVTVIVEDERGEAWRKRRVAPPLPAVDPLTGAPGVAVVDVDAPAGTFRAPGAFHVRASIDPPATQPGADALALDSTRWAALDVRDRVRVLAWTRASQGARQVPLSLLRPIFDPVPQEGTTGASPAPPAFEFSHADSESTFAARLAASTGRPDLVVLANTAPRTASTLAALRQHVLDGGGLLAFMGDAIDPAMWKEPPGMAEEAAGPLLPVALEPASVPARNAGDPAPYRLDLATPSDEPWARAFSGPEVALWLGRFPPDVLGRLALAEPSVPQASGPRAARVVLRWVEGRGPAMVEGRLGLGRTLWVGTSADEGWLRLGVPFFLPVFLDEAAFHLVQGESTARSLLVGDALEAVLPRGAEGERLEGPGGRDASLRLLSAETAAARRRVACEVTGTVGAWRLTSRVDGSRTATAWHAVNVDPDEGSLLRADPQAVVASAGPEAPVEVVTSLRAMATTTQEVREGELARVLLAIVLGLLLAESLLAHLLGRRARAAEGGPGSAA